MLNLEQLGKSFGLHQHHQMKKDNEVNNNFIEIRKEIRDLVVQINGLQLHTHGEKSISLWEWISWRMKK